MSPLDLFLSKLDGVKQTRDNQWQARCPAHDDKYPSMGVTVRTGANGNDKVVFNCQAGCTGREVMDAVGLDFGDLSYSRANAKKPYRKRLHFNLKVQYAIIEAAGELWRKGHEFNQSEIGLIMDATDKIAYAKKHGY